MMRGFSVLALLAAAGTTASSCARITVGRSLRRPRARSTSCSATRRRPRAPRPRSRRAGARACLRLRRRVQRNDRCSGLQYREERDHELRPSSRAAARRGRPAGRRDPEGATPWRVAHRSRCSANVALVSPTTASLSGARAAARVSSSWVSIPSRLRVAGTPPLPGDERAHLRDRAEVLERHELRLGRCRTSNSSSMKSTISMIPIESTIAVLMSGESVVKRVVRCPEELVDDVRTDRRLDRLAHENLPGWSERLWGR